MKRITLLLVAVATVAGGVAFTATASRHADGGAAPVFVKTIPPGYRDWRLISVAREEGGLNDIRAILGNDVAIKAYREGKLPFPDGAIIARIAWGYDASEENNKIFCGFAPASCGHPQSFVAGQPKNGVQFMVKDSRKYASTGGRGFTPVRRRQARWRGGARHLLTSPRDRRGPRLRLQPLRTLRVDRGEHQATLIPARQ
jgi:hypothetical protein